MMSGICDYFMADPIDKAYHDREWGRPEHDDSRLFESLSMEVMQCGLSWRLCLSRRAALRRCFFDFNIDRVAVMDNDDVRRVLLDEEMIRSERKIRAVINNARAAREIGSLDNYFWSFTDGDALVYDGHPDGGIPTENGLSRKIAADLRRRGMTFVGPVNIYAHLQACGIINDHSGGCPVYKTIIENYPIKRLQRDNET